MSVSYMQVVTAEGGRVLAILTTEHAVSSYGQPVVVVAGEALGVADLEGRYPGYRLDGSMAARALALMTGYKVVSPR